MAESVAGTGTSSDSSSYGGTSLEDAVGQMFGDATGDSSDETPSGSTSDAAGAPPAERQAAPDGTVPEGTAPAERAGAPPADAATAPKPDDAGQSTTDTPTEDPLATATPFTYTVNGETRSVDGIKVLGEHGAIVEPQALELLQRRLGERDHLFETNREQYQKVQDYERLSAFHTKDAEGKDTVLSGLDGLREGRVQLGTLAAEFNIVASIFTPDAQGKYSKLASLIALNDQQEIVPNLSALEHLRTQADLAALQAKEAVIRHFGTPAPAQQAAPINYEQAAPVLIQAAGKAANVDVKTLTDKDTAFLTQQFPRYVRTATEQDRRTNPTIKVGGPIVDDAFTQLVKDRVELRAEMSKTATATASAAKENATRLAAAAIGTKTPPKPAVVTRTPTPADTRVSDADAAWALRERLTSGRFSS